MSGIDAAAAMLMTAGSWGVGEPTPEQVRDFKAAQWDRFRQLAAQMPDHHVLAIELVRTPDNATAAVFTVAQNGVPVRSIVFGDERGVALPTSEYGRRYEALVKSDVDVDVAVAQPLALPALASLGSTLLASAFNDNAELAG